MSEWIHSVADGTVSKSGPNPHSVITGAILCLVLSSFDLVDESSKSMLEVLLKLLFLQPDDDEKEGCSMYYDLLKCLSSDELQ